MGDDAKLAAQKVHLKVTGHDEKVHQRGTYCDESQRNFVAVERFQQGDEKRKHQDDQKGITRAIM